MKTTIREMFPNLDFGDFVKGKDVRLAIGSTEVPKINAIIKEQRKALGKVGSYEFAGHRSYLSRGRGKGGFIQPLYDLAEISRVIDVEPYVAQSVKKHKETILKEGYVVAGEEPEMTAYINQRLFEFFLVTDITTEQWMTDLIHNLVVYHTAFLVLRRSKDQSTGRMVQRNNKKLEPICGIYVPDSSTMEVSVNKYGDIKRYRQCIRSSGLYTEGTGAKEFPPEDVIMITIDKKSGYSFGTPYILPVLDDIRALRQLEEIAAILAAKEAFPVYHVKVGTPESPARILEEGFNEINLVEAQIENLPEQGFAVTNERVEIKVVSSEGSSLDIKPFLEYFEARVLAGLRLSPLDLGRGSSLNRGTATNVSKNVQESAKEYQRTLIDQLSYKLFLPLLLEGSFDVTHENLVKLRFPMIDREEMRAQQNHGLQLFMGNTITIDEFRKEYLDKDPMSEEDFDNKTTQAYQLKQQLKVIAATPRPTTSSGGGDLFKPLKPIGGAVATKAQPENQHGKLATKSRFTKNDYTHSILNKLYSIGDHLEDIEDLVEISERFADFTNYFVASSENAIEEAIFKGWEQAKQLLKVDKEVDELGNRPIENFFNNYIKKSLRIRLRDNIIAIEKEFQKDIAGNDTRFKTTQHLSNAGKIVSELMDEQIETAKRFGFASYAKRIGCDQIIVKNKVNGLQRTIDISPITYTNLMPGNEGIGCKIMINQND